MRIREVIMLKWLLVIGLSCIGPLSAQVKVVAFSGSTREQSVNKKLLQEAVKVAERMGAEVKVIDLRDFPMPFYDGDIEAKLGMPEHAKRFRQLLIESDAVLITSPEYNGSVSGILKNTLDWASRSENGQPSRDAFKGKKFAIMSASPGPGGGARGLEHLRTIIENVGGIVVQQRLSVPNAYNAFDPQGALRDDTLKHKLSEEIQQLLQ
jgi:chromate reductase, NAD(P)H dehydrogenase (quinone)